MKGNPPTLSTETAVRVVAHLRKQIIAGQFNPGDLFHTRLEMCSELFSLAGEIIQKILDSRITHGRVFTHHNLAHQKTAAAAINDSCGCG